MPAKRNGKKAIIEVLLSTGCREMEARNIKLEDIAGNKIKVLGKGNKERFVYLNAKAMVAVERYREKRKDKSPYLFPRCTVRVGEGSKKLIELVESKKGKWWEYEKLVANEPATKGSLNATVRGIGKRVGVEAHAHKFRRTCATWALKHGMPIEQVSMMLGHASVATTQIYLDIKEKDLEISHERYVTG